MNERQIVIKDHPTTLIPYKKDKTLSEVIVDLQSIEFTLSNDNNVVLVECSEDLEFYTKELETQEEADSRVLRMRTSQQHIEKLEKEQLKKLLEKYPDEKL